MSAVLELIASLPIARNPEVEAEIEEIAALEEAAREQGRRRAESEALRRAPRPAARPRAEFDRD